MFARSFCLLWAACALTAWTDGRADDGSTDALVSAYDEGDSASFFKLLTDVVATAKRNPEKLAALDEGLPPGKPSLGMMTLEMRARLVAGGGDFLNPRPSPGEGLLLLPALVGKAEQVIKHVRELPIMQPRVDLPKEIDEFDALFRQLTEAQQQCGAFQQLVKQGAKLQPSAKRQRGLTEEQQAAAQRDLSELAGQLAELHHQITYRDVLLRLRRVDAAIAVLKDSNDAKQRLVAAHTLDYDTSLLLKLYRAPSWKKISEGMQASPQLPQETEAKLAEGKQLAGDDWDIAKLLFTGIHFWVQGRYGRSSEFFGLIKPQSASQGPGQSVYLPPDYSSSNYQPIDRRHHYTWPWETRQVIQRRSVQVDRKLVRQPERTRPATRTNVGVGSAPPVAARVVRMRPAPTGGGGNVHSSGNVSRPPYFQLPYGHQYGTIDRPYSWTTADVYRKHGYKPPEPYNKPKRVAPLSGYRVLIDDYQHVPRQDPRQVQQIVGFSEYVKALECFDALVHICDQDQLQAVDELIKERDELEIDTNLSQKVQRQLGPLDLPAGAPKTRRGLIWVTALARCEVAAMLVGFADQINAFLDLAKPYDQEAYRELVRDALVTHFWSLKNDPALMSVATTGSGTHVLAYLRRVLLTHSLMNATAALHKDTFNATHQQQMAVWLTELKRIAALLTQRFRTFTGP